MCCPYTPVWDHLPEHGQSTKSILIPLPQKPSHSSAAGVQSPDPSPLHPGMLTGLVWCGSYAGTAAEFLGTVVLSCPEETPTRFSLTSGSCNLSTPSPEMVPKPSIGG